MLMNTHRIEGIKYNFDRLSDGELEGIRGHLLESHQRITDEIGLIDRALFARRHDELPGVTGRENYEHMIGHAVLTGEIDAHEAYQALEQYDADTA